MKIQGCKQSCRRNICGSTGSFLATIRCCLQEVVYIVKRGIVTSVEVYSKKQRDESFGIRKNKEVALGLVPENSVSKYRPKPLL